MDSALLNEKTSSRRHQVIETSWNNYFCRQCRNQINLHIHPIPTITTYYNGYRDPFTFLTSIYVSSTIKESCVWEWLGFIIVILCLWGRWEIYNLSSYSQHCSQWNNTFMWQCRVCFNCFSIFNSILRQLR